MKLLQKNLPKNILILASALLLTACNKNAGSSANAKSLVNKTLKGRATIVKEFDAVGNLEGFVVAPKAAGGQQSVLYADKGGRYIVLGNIISADGKNLYQENYQKYVTGVTAPKAYRDAAKTNWFLMGKKDAPHKTYMIIEPNCSACHMAYERIKPMIASGQLAVRFITVSFLKPDSEGKAAAILTAKDPSAAFASDEKGFVMKTESGGIKPLKTIDTATKAKIKANIAFMQKHQFAATPVFIYKTTKKTYQSQIGFPGNEQGAKTMIDSMASKF